MKLSPFQAMSEEQLAALLAKLEEDTGLREKLQGAADLDAAVALAKEAGFDVSQADWLAYQAQQTFELSDDQLGEVSGGNMELLMKTVENLGGYEQFDIPDHGTHIMK